MIAQRMLVLAAALLALGCPPSATPGEGGGQPERRVRRDDGRAGSDEPRVDPSRCTGEQLDLRALIEAGACTVEASEARPLPGPELLAIDVPDELRVAPGGRLDFDLLLRNVGPNELVLDLAFRRLLPLGPERTERLDDGDAPDPSCTLRAISTEPPPERITLPPRAELAVPCQWFANARLVDPDSYVGSECADFPALAPGHYRSVFVVGGGAGSSRELTVEIVVR